MRLIAVPQRLIAICMQVMVAATVLLLVAAAGPWAAGLLATSPAVVLVEDTVVGAGGDTGTIDSIDLPIRANMVGGSWEGTAEELEIRARGARGGWSDWAPFEAEADEGPDPNSVEASNSTRNQVTVPVWVGDATDVQVRVVDGKRVRNLELAYVNSTGTARHSDRMINSLRTTAAEALGDGDAAAYPPRPGIISRASWGADESIRKGGISTAPQLKAAVLHHTVGVNSYSRTESAAIVRGIYTYHVRSNGWNDIGYNFLIDKYGRAYEGRYGGTTRNVIGAHTMGFNTATTGIAVMGTHTSTALSSATKTAISNLVSWRLDKAHVNPNASTRLTSAGNDKFAAGSTTSARALSGHRDLYLTACPGSAAYSNINALRSAAWTSGGPKFANPTAAATFNADASVKSLTVKAQGNRTLTYTLKVVRHSDNALVHQASQRATNAVMSWNGSSPLGAIPRWDLRWDMTASDAGVQATPYAEKLGTAPPPAVVATLLRQSAAVFAPNGDRLHDRLDLRYSLNTPAKVTVTLTDTSNGQVSKLFSGRTIAAGNRTLSLDGTAAGSPLPNGDYRLTLDAIDPLGRGEAYDSSFETTFGIDRTIAFHSVNRVISPNGDRAYDRARARLTMTRSSALTMSIHQRDGTAVRTTSFDNLAEQRWTIGWDGRTDDKTVVPDGRYTMRLRSQFSPLELRRPVIVDNTVPVGYAYARRRASGAIRISVSEPVKVIGYVRLSDGRTVRRTARIRRGWSTLRKFPRTRTLTIVDRVANSRRIKVRRR